MSENKHTPEPLSYGEDNDGWYVARGNEQIGYCLTEDDARRIVACVNACDGLDVEELERFGLGSALGSEIVNLRRMRDDLLAALEKCRKELSAWMRDHGEDIGTREAVSEARAAIASAKSYGHPDKSAENETTIPAIIFYLAGSLGEEVAP